MPREKGPYQGNQLYTQEPTQACPPPESRPEAAAGHRVALPQGGSVWPSDMDAERG